MFVLAPYTPVGVTSDLFPGTWYLTAVDDKHRRQYAVAAAEMSGNGQALTEPVSIIMYPSQ